MATTVKQNGIGKATSTTAKAKVKQQLATEAIDPKTTQSLDDRIESFEKLRGLATQRERLVDTLGELNKFKYSNGDSCIFMLRDEHNKEFKTTNTNLIKLVTDNLQATLQKRKGELEAEILQFTL